MAFRHDEECVSCENDRLNRSECKEYRKRPLTERTNPTTELSLDRDDRLAGNRKSVVAATHTEGLYSCELYSKAMAVWQITYFDIFVILGKSDILTIVVLILMAGAIICVIVLVFVRNKRHHGSPVTDKGQANVWGSTSTKLGKCSYHVTLLSSTKHFYIRVSKAIWFIILIWQCFLYFWFCVAEEINIEADCGLLHSKGNMFLSLKRNQVNWSSSSYSVLDNTRTRFLMMWYFLV